MNNIKLKLLSAITISLSAFSSPAFAEEPNKGIYTNFGIGGGRVTDIDFGYLGTLGFEVGIETEVGIGYAFGERYRAELNYGINGSDFENTTTSAGYVDLCMQTISLNGHFDFPNESKFTPFVGLGIGSTFVEVSGGDDTTLSLSFAIGGAYKISESFDLVGKLTHRRFGELDLGLVTIEDASVNSGVVGVRWRFRP